MMQNYVNPIDCLTDLNIQHLLEYTKDYTLNHTIDYVKARYPECWRVVMEQITLHDKLVKKLPNWALAGCLVTTKSLEQCSSWPLAVFKSTLVEGDILVDLSAGLGVDDVAFSSKFNQVFSVDVNEALNDLVRYNLNQLQVSNVERYTIEAEEWLKQHQEAIDVYYMDADRRDTRQQKVYTLTDSTPNVFQLLPYLAKYGKQLLLKLSPMIDLSYVKQSLPGITHIYVVGYKNEVKEVLVLINLHQTSVSVEPPIVAVEVDSLGQVLHQFYQKQTTNTPVHDDPTNCRFFYEPSVMIIKAGLSVDYAYHCGLTLSAKNSHYMFGHDWIPHYFGRAFEVVHFGQFSKSIFVAYCKQLQLSKANVSVRNFVLPVDQLRKQFNLAEGGDEYLFFTTNAQHQKVFWHTRKVSSQ